MSEVNQPIFMVMLTSGPIACSTTMGLTLMSWGYSLRVRRAVDLAVNLPHKGGVLRPRGPVDRPRDYLLANTGRHRLQRVDKAQR